MKLKVQFYTQFKRDVKLALGLLDLGEGMLQLNLK